jgi:hypothetical protein
MKKALLFVLLILPAIAFTQTEELEKRSLTERYEEGEFSHETYLQYATEWRDLLLEYGGYPDISFNNQNNRIEYIRIYEFPDFDKKDIYNRLLEWAAINFGELSSVLHYSDLESGKIILKGNFSIFYKGFYKNFWGNKKQKSISRKSFQTYIFTIKDNKLKLEVVNFTYKYKIYGYSAGNYYIPTETFELDIQDIYPVTNHEPLEWLANLDLLVKTKDKVVLLMYNIDTFINERTEDYSF